MMLAVGAIPLLTISQVGEQASKAIGADLEKVLGSLLSEGRADALSFLSKSEIFSKEVRMRAEQAYSLLLSVQGKKAAAARGRKESQAPSGSEGKDKKKDDKGKRR